MVVPALVKLGALAAAVYALTRGGQKKEPVPNESGGLLVENVGGVVQVKTSAVAWTLANLRGKLVAPRDIGGGVLVAPIGDGGMDAMAWANYQQSLGRDVAISLPQDPSDRGGLACFPPSLARTYCAPGRNWARLLRAAPQAAAPSPPAPSGGPYPAGPPLPYYGPGTGP